METETEKMQTKYPILLVHGIALKEGKIFHAFGKIGKKLQSQGYKIHIGRHDGFGTIENNAAQLKAQIEEILVKENVEKVNLIAHSKGGLDCKYLIRELNMEDKIASLTTLCTPHSGSPVASWILKHPKFMVKIIAFWLNFWYRIFGDKHPDSLTVCKQLQLHDNDEDTMHFSDKVYCQSFSATLEKSKNDFIMAIPLYVSKKIMPSESDGVVPVESAMFGNYRGSCLPESVSHSQMVDFLTSRKKKEKIYSFYSAICKELSDMGF